jgi:hypothetical protein
MKKNVARRVMKCSLLFVIFCLLTAQASIAQDCKTLAANKPSVSVRFPDAYSGNTSYQTKPGSWNITNIKQNLANTERWVKNMLTGFRGAKLAYSNDYFLEYADDKKAQEFYKTTGTSGFYRGVMRFYAYYCNDNNPKVYTEDECGSFIYMVFNNVLATGLCTDVGVVTVNGKPVFRAFAKSHSEGRTDYYEQIAMSNINDTIYKSKNEYILFRNSDQPVFIPVTRKEYLEQMLKDIDTQGISDTKDFTESYNRNINQFEEEMKRYKSTDKTYTPEKEAKRRKWFDEDQEKLKKLIDKTSADAAPAREMVQQYLKKSGEWLNRGFQYFYGNSFTAKGIREYWENLDKPSSSEETQYEVVSINPAYYNKVLGTDAVQLLLLELQKGTYPHMLKVASLVKQAGALSPLQAILTPAKNPVP